MRKKTDGLTKEQLKIRRQGIGASEIPVIAGLSPWGSAAEIYAEKRGLSERTANLRMKLGTLTEDPIATLWEEEQGGAFHLYKAGTLVHPAHPYVLATPDRVAFKAKQKRGAIEWKEADHLVQVKHSSWRVRGAWGEPGSDQVPEEYLAQVTWEMGTFNGRYGTKISRCAVVVLFDKDELCGYSVPFDPTLFESLRTIGEHWWATYVLAGVTPPPEASERYREALSSIYPTPKNQDLRYATPEIEALAAQLRILEAVEKEAKARGELIRNALRRFIGEATGFVCPVGTITWKKNADGSDTDWEAVARGLRDQLEEALGDASGETSAPLRIADEEFAKLVAAHTKIKPGPRVLRKSWTKTLPPALEVRLPIVAAIVEDGIPRAAAADLVPAVPPIPELPELATSAPSDSNAA